MDRPKSNPRSALLNSKPNGRTPRHRFSRNGGRLRNTHIHRTLWLPATAWLLSGCPSDAGVQQCDTAGALVVECPADVELQCVSSLGAVVEFQAAGYICGGEAVATSCSIPSGALVDPGTTTVECSASTETLGTQRCTFDVVATPAGLPFLRCPEDVTVTCSGPRTPVSLPVAVLDETCGAATGNIGNDAPAAGFPVGTTQLTFSVPAPGGATSTCRSQVVVVDTTPPEMACAATQRLLLQEDVPAAPPTPQAEDLCDSSVMVSALPTRVQRGSAEVRFTARNASGLTTECSTTFDVKEAFAVARPHLVAARLDESQATDFTIGWQGSTGRDVTGYRIERGTQEAGPFESVGVTGAEARIFTDTGVISPRVWYRVVSLVDGEGGGSSEPLRVYSLDQADYVLRDQSIARVPFRTSLAGLLRYPRSFADGPIPVAFLMHGNNGICRFPGTTADTCDPSESHECSLPGGWQTSPNAAGLSYLADTLAARGMLVVSINANALNCRSAFVEQRAELFLAHLREWIDWNAAPAAPFGNLFVNRLDLSQTILFGRDRSGEAALRAAELLEQFPINGAALRGLFAVAPSDVEGVTPPDLPLGLMVPACGGVVDPEEAVAAFDRVSVAPSQSPRSMVFLEGANHRFFNSNWVSDDGSIALQCNTSDLIPRFSQQAALETTVGEWVDTLAGKPSPFLESIAPASDATLAWAATPLRMRTSYVAQETLIDRFDATGAPTSNLLGGTNEFVGFATTSLCPTSTGCGGSFVHRVGALILGWTSTASPTARFDIQNATTSQNTVISFRVTSRDVAANVGKTAQEFTIRVVDGAGTNAEVLVSERTEIPHLFDARRPFESLQTVRVPLSAFRDRAPSLNVADLERLELVMNPDGSAGEIAITRIAITP